MRYIAQITVIIIAIFPLVVASAPFLSSISFRVFDADSKTALAAKLSIDGNSLIDKKYVISHDAESQIAIEVSVDAGIQYTTRQITIFLAGLKQENSIYNIYMAKPNQEKSIYTRGLVNKASSFINKEDVDRAVVLLERINQEAAPALRETQFGVYLRYNLARAYFLNCTMRFVDQCGIAKSLFEELLKQYDTDERVFIAERIKRENLSDLDIDTYYKRNDYLRAKWDLSRGRPIDAKSAFERLLYEAQKDPTLLTRLNITLEVLKSDIDFVQTKISQQ